MMLQHVSTFVAAACVASLINAETPADKEPLVAVPTPSVVSRPERTVIVTQAPQPVRQPVAAVVRTPQVVCYDTDGDGINDTCSTPSRLPTAAAIVTRTRTQPNTRYVVTAPAVVRVGTTYTTYRPRYTVRRTYRRVWRWRR